MRKSIAALHGVTSTSGENVDSVFYILVPFVCEACTSVHVCLFDVRKGKGAFKEYAPCLMETIQLTNAVRGDSYLHWTTSQSAHCTLGICMSTV